jgi:hypothetical protein
MSETRRPLSEKQLAANRANARKSTGPRTPQGKARSSMNRLLHGLRSRTVALPNENPRLFDSFARAMRRDLRPRGPVETVLVEQVVRTAWMLRRAGRAEGEVARRVLERYGSAADTVTAGKLLADAIVGDPRAEPFLNVELYAGQLQRSFFTALWRLHAARRKPVVRQCPKTNEAADEALDEELENEVNRILAIACAAADGGAAPGPLSAITTFEPVAAATKRNALPPGPL